VLERLQNSDLPDGVKSALGALSSPVGEIFRFDLKSDTLNPTELRSIEDWVVERQLKIVPGVADVVSRGDSG
jgi:cobalt-zinc-cadmium resistance protein CzcA